MSFSRSVERAQSKKLFKQFVKANPQYKAMTFQNFFKLTKAGIFNDSEDHVAKAEQEAESLTIEDFEDVMLDNIEE